MTTHRICAALAALTLCAPALASAQDPIGRPLREHEVRAADRARTVYRFVQRGMLGIYTEPVPAGALSARRQVVVDVVEDSPADRAGIAEGDTLLSINDLAASHQVMSLPFEPGDTLTLRIRRDGNERDVTVVAAERAPLNRFMLPDSIGERVSVMVNRYLADADSLAVRVRSAPLVHRLFTDSSTTIIIGTDTITTVHGRPAFTFRFDDLPPDSIRELMGRMYFRTDSMRHNFEMGMGDYTFPDSARWHFRGSLPNFSDSANVHFFTPGTTSWNFTVPDSTFVRGFDILTANTIVGLRAVAGAELAPLNPGLSEYFGTTDGVLVLNARNGTPAARAGLRAGDVIVRVGDVAVNSIPELRREIERSTGEDVVLRVVRRGQNVDVTLSR